MFKASFTVRENDRERQGNAPFVPFLKMIFLFPTFEKGSFKKVRLPKDTVGKAIPRGFEKGMTRLAKPQS